MNISNRRLVFYFLGMSFGAAVFWMWPVHSRATTLLTVLFAAVFLLLLLAAAYKNGFIRWAMAVTMMFFLAFFSKKTIDGSALRTEFVGALNSYENTQYLWGGEGKMGIDCSGLIRQSLINALFIHGIKTQNTQALRDSLHFWWNDFSAKDMGSGLGGWLTNISESDSINTLEVGKLNPGDIAVTRNGVHVLAYTGDSEWIQADPGEMKVHSNKTPSENNWLKVPVRVLRWKYF